VLPLPITITNFGDLKLNITDYPEIVVYRYHLMAIFYSRDELSLTAAGESIALTVPASHKELPMLVEAGKQKREEFKQAAQEKVS
jgi:hypothetical protein